MQPFVTSVFVPVIILVSKRIVHQKAPQCKENYRAENYRAGERGGVPRVQETGCNRSVAGMSEKRA